MRLLAPLTLLLLTLALISCADSRLPDPKPQPIVPGDSLRSSTY